MITVDTTLSERYHLESLLGRGGMADVFRARDLVLERPVAVKVVRGAGEEDARRFAREIRAMAALSHPSIVRLFDAGTHHGAPYLVMELVEGEPLPSRLEVGPLSSTRVTEMGRELARALAHAHGLHIVHRDVKPANVLLGVDGRTRLSDFGIARLADATRVTTPGMTSGTAAYLAPEQLQGDDVGSAADVYSLGLVLLEALTGRREFTGTPVEAAMARLQRAPHIDDDLAPPWPSLLGAMTARDPGQRPTAGQVSARLAGGEAVTPVDDAPTIAMRAEPSTAAPAPPDTADEPVSEEPVHEEPVHEEPVHEGPVHADAGSRARDAQRKKLTAAVALLLTGAAAVLLLVLGTDGGDGGAPPDTVPPPAETDTTLPAEVDEALRRLEEAVRP